MVDFQSRDTRRGPTTGDDDGEDDEPAGDDADADAPEEAEPDAGEGDRAEAPQAETEDQTDAAAAAQNGDPATDAGAETAGTAHSGDEDDAEDDERGAVEGEGARSDRADPLAAEETRRASGGDPLSEDGEAAATAVTEDATVPDQSRSGEADEPSVDPEDVEEAIAARERGRGEEAPLESESEPESDAAARDADGSTNGEADQTTEASGRAGRAATASTAPRTTVSTAIVTVSRDRTHENDPGGEAIERALDEAGHEVVTRELLRPTYDTVQQTLDTLVGREDVDVVVTNGGTGVTEHDVTVEALHPIIDKALPGFGELFRSLYFDEVGTDVLATRATAGIAEGTPVFALPGDGAAASLGTREIVVDQASALVEALEGEDPSDP